MSLILEVDDYEDLDGLANDVKQAVASNPNKIFSRVDPMKIEVSEDIFKSVETELRAHGSYPGLRNTNEFMAHVWMVAETPVVFITKKREV